MLQWLGRSVRRLEEERHRFHDFLLDVDSGDKRLSLFTRAILYFIRVIYYACKGFWYDDGFSRAAGLAYSMLCSLIPLAVLLLYVILNENLPFGIHEYGLEAKNFLIGMIAPGHVEDAKKFVDSACEALANKRDPLGVAGLGILLLIAFSFLNMLEGAMNHIWKVTSPPIRLGRFPAFLLILGLVAAIIGLTLLANLPPTLAGPIQLVLPWLTVFTIFFLILYLVPNTRVNFLPALLVALLTAGIWLAMERGYAFYLAMIFDHVELWGPIGLIPLVLLWIYLTACLLLFGGEATYVCHHFKAVADRRFRIVIRSRFFREYLALRILLLLASENGRPLPFKRLIGKIPVPEAEIKEGLQRLRKGGLVRRRIFKGYLLARSPGAIKLKTLFQLGRHGFEQLALVRDESAQGAWCLGLIGRIVERAASVPADHTLQDAIDQLAAEGEDRSRPLAGAEPEPDRTGEEGGDMGPASPPPPSA